MPIRLVNAHGFHDVAHGSVVAALIIVLIPERRLRRLAGRTAAPTSPPIRANSTTVNGFFYQLVYQGSL
jgi:hypothetical protein